MVVFTLAGVIVGLLSKRRGGGGGGRRRRVLEEGSEVEQQLVRPLYEAQYMMNSLIRSRGVRAHVGSVNDDVVDR